MATNRFVIVCIHLSILFYQITQTSSEKDPALDVWSCPFDTDFCQWEVIKTVAAKPAGPLIDLGWRIFSAHAGDEISPTLQKSLGSTKFAYLESLAELRSELTSPVRNNCSEIKGILLSFHYFTLNGATLSLSVVKNDSYSLAWASPEIEIEGENSTSPDNASVYWTRVAQCLPHKRSAEETDQNCPPRISFIGHAEPNSKIGLRLVKVVELQTECAVDDIEATETKLGTDKEDVVQNHVAWRFLIILSLFLCFGALFLTTVVVVFGGAKGKLGGQKRRHEAPRRRSEGEFINPAFQFQYQRLQPI